MYQMRTLPRMDMILQMCSILQVCMILQMRTTFDTTIAIPSQLRVLSIIIIQ